MTERKTVVQNKAGIHCRPSSIIMLAVQEYLNCKISIHSKKGDSELNGILSLISLGLEKGDEVLVRADGENEREACARIADIFSNEFDFPSMDEQENVNVFV